MSELEMILYGINFLGVIIYIIMQKAPSLRMICGAGIILLLSFIKILDEIKGKQIIEKFGFLINLSESLNIFLGITATMLTIYTLFTNLNDEFKKSILYILLGKGRVLYLIIFMFGLYFLNIESLYFWGLIIVIFLEFYNMIEMTCYIINTDYFRKNWKKVIIPRLMRDKKGNDLENIYYELRKRITQAVLERNFIVFEEMLAYYKDLLMTDGFEVPEDFIEKAENKEKAVRFLYNLYITLLKEEDENLLRKLSYLNIEFGNYYLMKNNVEIAGAYYSFIDLKYECYKNFSRVDNKGTYIFEGIDNYMYYNYYQENFSLEKEIAILKPVLDLFMSFVEKERFDEIEEYKNFFEQGRTKLKDYILIVIIYFLRKNEKSLETIKVLENILMKKRITLEDIYCYNLENDLERKLILWKYLAERDKAFGRGVAIYSSNFIGEEILRIMNKENLYISKEFFKNNEKDIKDIVKECKLENLSKRIEKLEKEI